MIAGLLIRKESTINPDLIKSERNCYKDGDIVCVYKDAQCRDAPVLSNRHYIIRFSNLVNLQGLGQYACHWRRNVDIVETSKNIFEYSANVKSAKQYEKITSYDTAKIVNKEGLSKISESVNKAEYAYSPYDTYDKRDEIILDLKSSPGVTKVKLKKEIDSQSWIITITKAGKNYDKKIKVMNEAEQVTDLNRKIFQNIIRKSCYHFRYNDLPKAKLDELTSNRIIELDWNTYKTYIRNKITEKDLV